jgi:hypothetical protein
MLINYHYQHFCKQNGFKVKGASVTVQGGCERGLHMQGVYGHGGDFHDPAVKSLHTLLNGRLVGPKRLIEHVEENL